MVSIWADRPADRHLLAGHLSAFEHTYGASRAYTRVRARTQPTEADDWLLILIGSIMYVILIVSSPSARSVSGLEFYYSSTTGELRTFGGR